MERLMNQPPHNSADGPGSPSGEKSRDPLLGAMLQAWMNNQENSHGGSAAAAAGSAEASQEREVRLRKTIRKLRFDLSAADEMLRHMANIFGSCEACWGMHSDCPRCRGTGTPGCAMPLRDELLAWVIPALNRLGLEVVPATGHATAAGPHRNKPKEKSTHAR
jgi:hypothetical protein